MSGSERRIRAQGARHETLLAALTNADPDLAKWADGFIFDEVWGRDGLEFEDRMLVAIVALAAINRPAQLRNYLHGALQDGMSPCRIHEALMMLVVYVGFPTALEAIGVWRDVVISSRKRGMTVELPMR
jgi:4-carboxymuconolactone decarboxylase